MLRLLVCDSIILYDSVPGGAGHIHRIAADESVFRSVVSKAYEICSECECSPSCYKCLRDYYNQDWHALLNRESAADFLRQYLTTPSMHPMQKSIEPAKDDFRLF